MTTEQIIRSKVEEQINDNESGFSDVFNGKRTSTHTHYHLNLITVSIAGLPSKEFGNKDTKGIQDYIIDNTCYKTKNLKK